LRLCCSQTDRERERERLVILECFKRERERERGREDFSETANKHATRKWIERADALSTNKRVEKALEGA